LPHRDFFVKIIESFVPQGKELGEREREEGRERERGLLLLLLLGRERVLGGFELVLFLFHSR